MSTYMNGLAGVDVDAMVSSFAVETFVDHFDFRAYLERLGVYSATVTPVVVPAETPFARALGVEQRHGDVIGQIRLPVPRACRPRARADRSRSASTRRRSRSEDFYSGRTWPRRSPRWTSPRSGRSRSCRWPTSHPAGRRGRTSPSRTKPTSRHDSAQKCSVPTRSPISSVRFTVVASDLASVLRAGVVARRRWSTAERRLAAGGSSASPRST